MTPEEFRAIKEFQNRRRQGSNASRHATSKMTAIDLLYDEATKPNIIGEFEPAMRAITKGVSFPFVHGLFKSET